MGKYLKKSKNQRSNYWWEIRERCQRSGKLFYTHQHLENNSWLDFWFVGRKPDVYCAVIDTAKYAYKEGLFSPAWDASEKIKPLPDDWSWRTSNQDEDLIEGISRYDWIGIKEKELADSGAFPVYESAIIEEYDHAWGLQIIVDVEDITEEVINDFITGWDYKPYKRQKPLTFKSSELYWGLEANFIPMEGLEENV